MADHARRRGYAYQVLTDHTQSLTIAGGLTPDRVAEQAEIIAALNATFAAEEAAGTAPPETPPEGFRLLHGCELEIRADGALDFEDDLLARFDVVVASVHVSRRQSRAELTRRTLNGIRSPHVDVIAHPSGRKIGQRDDLDLDWDAVYAEAARTGTALEMNGSPPRLDLAVERARRAVSVGCLLTDRFGRALHPRARLRALGDQPGASGVGHAGGRAQHAVARGPAGLDRREAGARVNAPRPIAAMDDRSARHDLALVAVTVVGLSRLLEPPVIWLVAAALLGAMLLGTLQVLTDEVHPSQAWFGIPIESVILPSVAAVGLSRGDPAGAVRAVAHTRARHHLADRRADAHARGEDQPDRRPARPRTTGRALLVTILLVAFLAFTGVAAMVPGGLAQAGGALGESNLLDPCRGRRPRRRAARLPGGVAAGDDRARRALVGGDVRGGHRDRRCGPAGDGDPATDRAGAADPRLLPVGCVHQHGTVASPGPALDRPDRACSSGWA